MGPYDTSNGRVAQHPDALTRVGRYLGVCVASLVALWLLYKIRLVLLILITGLAVAYALTPVVKTFSGNRPRLRALGIALAYLVVFFGLTTAQPFALSIAGGRTSR